MDKSVKSVKSDKFISFCPRVSLAGRIFNKVLPSREDLGGCCFVPSPAYVCLILRLRLLPQRLASLPARRLARLVSRLLELVSRRERVGVRGKFKTPPLILRKNKFLAKSSPPSRGGELKKPVKDLTDLSNLADLTDFVIKRRL